MQNINNEAALPIVDFAEEFSERARAHARIAFQRPAILRKGETCEDVELRDLSAGGAFLESQAVLCVGDVHELQIEDGFACQVEIIRQTEDGFGVCFRPSSEEESLRIAEFVAQHEAPPSPRRTNQLSGFMSNFHQGLFYEALGLTPEAKSHEIQLAVVGITERAFDLDDEERDNVLRSVPRIAAILGSAQQRAHYDFSRHIIDVGRRKREGQDFNMLADVWAKQFPLKVFRAEDRITVAMAAATKIDFATAAAEAELALLDHPFSLPIAARLVRWSATAEIVSLLVHREFDQHLHRVQKLARDSGMNQTFLDALRRRLCNSKVEVPEPINWEDPLDTEDGGEKW